MVSFFEWKLCGGNCVWPCWVNIIYSEQPSRVNGGAGSIYHNEINIPMFEDSSRC